MNTRLNLFIVGFVSSSVQLLLLREMMNITGGYELISGTFFGSWLITSAAGSVLAGKTKYSDLHKINLIFSLSPLLSIVLLLALSRLFFLPGQSPSFPESFIFTLIVLLPFSTASGFIFIKLIKSAKDVPGSSFSIETTGGIAAGVFISILTAGLLNTWQLILLIILLSGTWSLLIFDHMPRYTILVVKSFAVLFTALLLSINVDVFFRKILFPEVNVTATYDSPYGNITNGYFHGEQTTWYNHRLLAYEGDAAEREENVHYALLQCDNPTKAILVSGNLGSLLPELSKYKLKEVIYVERDPALAVVPPHVPGNIRVNVASTDGYRFIMNTDEKADAILVLVPPPSTLQLNRFFTTEFFIAAKKKLNENGVFMCSPGQSELYYNEESLLMFSSIYKSLKKSFKYVLAVAGNKLYFIASDKQLSTSFSELLKSKNIQNKYVNPDFVSDDLAEARSQEAMALFENGREENTVSFPVAYRGYQSNVLEKHDNAKTISIILIVILFALSFLFIGRKNIIMYTAASALAGFEIIVLLFLQLTAGNMYQLTGLILAGLMLGLAAGAGCKNEVLKTINPGLKNILLAFYFLVSAFLFEALLNIKSYIIIIIIILTISFIPSFITGNLFRHLTGENRSKAAATYGADLAGSAIGFILMSGFTIPFLGLRNSMLLLSVIVFTGAAVSRIRTNN